MNSKIIKWIPAGIAILVMIGYSISKEFPATQGSQTRAAQTLLPAEDQALTDKLQPFIKCLNNTDKSLLKHMAGYNEFFQRVSADLNQELHVNFSSFKIQVYETNNEFSRECANSLKTAITQKPSDAVLDKAGQDYASTLEALIPLMNEADDYYKQKNYRDDKLAKGRDLHARLWPLLTKISELSATIHTSVQQHQDRLADARLQEMEKEYGKEYRWHTQNVMLQASRTISKIDNIANTNTFDPKTLGEIETQMQHAYDDAVAYGAKNPNVKTSLGNKPMWFFIQSNVQNYLTAIKTLRRNLSDGKTDKIIANLNTLSDDYNRLIKNYNLQVNNGGE